MRIKVTFQPKAKGYEDKVIIETFNTTPHENGFVACYKTRAMALNWRVISVEEIFGHDGHELIMTIPGKPEDRVGEKIPPPPKEGQ